MDMLDAVKAILAGQKDEALILADWLDEHCQGHPELNYYLTKLRDPKKLRMQTLLDCIIKMGPKKQRSLCVKLIRRALRSKDRWSNKGTIRAYAKKRWSLTRPWYLATKLSEYLGTGAVTESP
jgi:hypothetical protein